METAAKLRMIDDILTMYLSCIIPESVAMDMIETVIAQEKAFKY